MSRSYDPDFDWESLVPDGTLSKADEDYYAAKQEDRDIHLFHDRQQTSFDRRRALRHG